MVDFENLPAPRPLPPAVRAAARQLLDEGISERPGAVHRGRSVLASTAAITAVLAVMGLGAVAFASLRPETAVVGADSGDAIRQLPPPVPEEMYGLRVAAAPADVQRCRAAPAVAGEASGWQPMFTASARGVTVIAFRATTGIRFCELTPATVSVSAAAPASDAAASITYVSRFGTVAGVVAQDINSVDVADPLLRWSLTEQGEPALVRDGAFVLPNAVTAAPSGLTLNLGGSPLRTAESISVPAAELPAQVTPRVDRPQPAAGGFSACAQDKNVAPLIDAHHWVPTTSVTLNATETIHLARYHGMLATCLIRNANGSPGSADLVVNEGLANDHRRDTEAEPNPFLFTTSVFYNFSALSSDTLAVAGLITDDRVASVAIGGAGRRPVTARIVNGTFVVPGVRLNDGAGPKSVTIADLAGNTLASVPLNGTEEVIPTPSGR
jgi:hypothetical protein